MALSQLRKNQGMNYNSNQRAQNNQFLGSSLSQGNSKSSGGMGSRTRGPAPQTYVFNDISNYEENEENKQQQQNHNNFADDTDFNSSCCDYQSDVFKEQPSQYIDDSNSKFLGGDLNLRDATVPGVLSLHECGSESDFKENLGYSSVMSPHGFHSVKQTITSHQQQMESQQSLRINVNSVQESLKKEYRSCNGEIKNRGIQYNQGAGQTSKTSCDHSLITPNYRTQHNGTSTTNKNILKNAPQNDESADCIMSGQITIQNNQQNQMMMNGNSYQQLTPQKNQPLPMSPSMKPSLSNYSKSGSGLPSNKILNLNSQGNQLQVQQYDSRNFQAQMPQSTKTQNSNSKATVVYNEFKYYTSGADLQNTQNPKKYINISSNNQRKSDISGSHISGQQPLQYELSPTSQQNIFDVSSPKHSMSNGQVSFTNGVGPAQVRANSIRKQIFNTDRNHHQPQQQKQQQPLNIIPQNYQLILKQENSQNEDQPLNQEVLFKIQQLQSYVEQLETDLQMSKTKNLELKKRFKEKSFIQSFDRNKKHLSDTEDSLILSEKKSKKNSIQNNSLNHRSSLPKQQQNGSLVQQQQPTSTFTQISNQNTNSHTGGSEIQQRSSSIVDVKIRPIMNLKNLQNHSGLSPNKMGRSTGSDNQNQDDNQADENTSSQNHNNHLSEDECEGCDRLKQLVFQAKEAIDDLKLEIEEWREICSEKETELRQLQHKIYNDIIGVDKKIEFNEEIQTKEFDSSKPVMSPDQRKIRNFIQHNKKRIRSRSKGAKNLCENGFSSQGQSISNRKGFINVAQSLKKKSALKSVRDLVSDDFEFYEAEDVGLQTSFDYCNNQNEKNHHLNHEFNVQELQTNVSIDSSNGLQNNHKKLSVFSGNSNQHLQIKQFVNLTTTPDKNNMQTTTNATHDNYENNQMIEELCTLRTKNQFQEQEMGKMRQQIGLLSGQIEKFMGLVQKSKKRNNKKNGANAIDIEDIKANYEIVSNIESYSILEKINEWKKEEGLLDAQQLHDQEPMPTQIPRPLKLLMDIDLTELDLPLDIAQKNQSHMNINSNNNALHQQFMNNSNNLSHIQHNSSNYQTNNAQEFMQMIKIEQENLKKQTDQKYKELQKQQQEYLNVLKGSTIN
eukprot:403338901